MEPSSMKTAAFVSTKPQHQKGKREGRVMDEDATFMPDLTLGYGLFLICLLYTSDAADE